MTKPASQDICRADVALPLGVGDALCQHRSRASQFLPAFDACWLAGCALELRGMCSFNKLTATWPCAQAAEEPHVEIMGEGMFTLVGH